MKITATQYAKSLYEVTREKKQSEIDGFVANFLKVLKKNNQMKLAGKIMEKFSAIYDAKNGIVEATVTSVKLLDEKTLQEVEKFVAKKYDAKKVILKNIVRKDIKGGIILQVGDEMLDASVVKKIDDLRNILNH
ncbi:MAG: ATP synthase F1 subunit delta [Parcubacteria group bacterium]